METGKLIKNPLTRETCLGLPDGTILRYCRSLTFPTPVYGTIECDGQDRWFRSMFLSNRRWIMAQWECYEVVSDGEAMLLKLEN